ncbi:hypothetical protein QBC43DRAFT_115082 [Cladorrhinum sp. PSN259]|nr:hypothetical protein QBC43DRAFT_115082 [Cladorrhinum sp. PSN259]
MFFFFLHFLQTMALFYLFTASQAYTDTASISNEFETLQFPSSLVPGHGGTQSFYRDTSTKHKSTVPFGSGLSYSFALLISFLHLTSR